MSRKRSQRLLCVVSCVVVCLATSAAPAAETYEVEVRNDVEYGTGAGETLTLHLAKPVGVEEPVPAIMVIHGGGWRAGSKDAHLGHIKQIAEHGYVAASVGYRFAPKHRFPGAGRRREMRRAVRAGACGRIGSGPGSYRGSWILGRCPPVDDAGDDRHRGRDGRRRRLVRSAEQGAGGRQFLRTGKDGPGNAQE